MGWFQLDIKEEHQKQNLEQNKALQNQTRDSESERMQPWPAGQTEWKAVQGQGRVNAHRKGQE